MKILLVADPNSIHTIRWEKALVARGIIVDVFGIDSHIISQKEGVFSKLSVLKLIPKLKQKIKNFQPDILHAHYASSYGLLGALSGFHPFVLSVWGSDVYTFPRKSFLHKKVLKYNLHKADHILSTSHAMAKETSLYTNKNIIVTPFGVDVSVFKPMTVSPQFQKGDIVIGTVKSLKPVYRIDILIHAFKYVYDNNKELPLKLLIVGEGPLKNELTKKVYKLRLEDNVVFAGKIEHSSVPQYQNLMDIIVIVSDSESFGVSAIEAMACCKPVIVSDVGGLPEVVQHDETGLVVKSNSPEMTAQAIQKLIDAPKLRRKMGQQGRRRVSRYYNWDKNVDQMIEIYTNSLVIT